MATQNKTAFKYQPSDWHVNSFALTHNSVSQIKVSHDERQETRALRLNVELKTKWDEYNNTTRLKHRIEAIRNWKELFEWGKELLEDEMAKLSKAKEAMEKQMFDTNTPLDAVNESLTLRDQRRNIDYVEDGPELHLKKEQKLILNLKNLLQAKIDESFEFLAVLKDVYHQILRHVENKTKAMDIDLDMYKLKECSLGVSFKIDPLRIPKGTITPQQWEQIAYFLWQRTRSELEASARLREAIQNLMCRVENELQAQASATDFALRRRMHELQQALDEDQWQKKNLEDEIAQMEEDLDKLEESINGTRPAQKLAETRLERRTRRPLCGELVRDNPQYGLVDEVKQIDASRKALLEKQSAMRRELDGLHRNLKRVMDDIMAKERSLGIEKKVLDLRQTRMDGSGIGPADKSDTIETSDKADGARLTSGQKLASTGNPHLWSHLLT